MNIFQRWRAILRRRRFIKAIGHYNIALQSLADAAEEIREVARDSGCITAEIECAVNNMQELAKTSLISTEDFEGRCGT